MRPFDVHERSAVISPCEAYRYMLTRGLSDSGTPRHRTAVFALLNPSTADAEKDDPTCVRGMGFSWSWGCDRMIFVNTNPHRSTDPDAVERPPETQLIINDEFARTAAAEAHLIVCAWGANVDSELAARMVEVLRSSGKALHHMGLTKGGMPAHPLYLHSETKPKKWDGSL